LSKIENHFSENTTKNLGYIVGYVFVNLFWKSPSHPPFINVIVHLYQPKFVFNWFITKIKTNFVFARYYVFSLVNQFNLLDGMLLRLYFFKNIERKKNDSDSVYKKILIWTISMKILSCYLLSKLLFKSNKLMIIFIFTIKIIT
jgi:hypothetical protein